MKRDRQAFREEVNCVLEDVAQKHGTAFADCIRPIIDANEEKGRLAYFLEGDSTKTASDYVWFVVDGYLQWHALLEQIQQERSESVWEPLRDKLVHWTYHFLLRKGFHPGKETLRTAEEYVTEVAIAILHADFPYDTELDAWLQQIVIYICCNQIEVWKRQEEIGKKLAQELADEKVLKVGNGGIEHQVTFGEESLRVYQAIWKLKNPKMRQVVWLRYYGEFSSQEIAEIIGSSYRYVDKLHWQAKQLLGKILAGEGYSYG